ncbi:MAG TPA: SAM-dependent chlorinase/fluorinase [Gammaproteobacteria bacterium]
MSAKMIVLFTDYGVAGPYVGQVKSVLTQCSPQTALIDLMHDAPSYDIEASAYLLAALVKEFPGNTVFLCVVDPGVGGNRTPVVVKAAEQWFVGPDNGLFDVVALFAATNAEVSWRRIAWQPQRLSSSFHGRDLFAPVAAMLANAEPVPGEPLPPEEKANIRWPSDLPKIIYLDHFGNAITGIRASAITTNQTIIVKGYQFGWARTFSDVNLGRGFWYENANGLVEIAVNQGHASQRYNLGVGDEVRIVMH